LKLYGGALSTGPPRKEYNSALSFLARRAGLKAAFLCLAFPVLLVAGVKTLPLASEFFDVDYDAVLVPGLELRYRVAPLSDREFTHMPMGSLAHAVFYDGITPEGLARSRWLLSAAALLLALALGGLTGSPARAVLAAVLWLGLTAVWPARPERAAWFLFMDDTFLALFNLMSWAVACVLVWRADRPSWGRSLLLGAALGATLLYRSTFVFFAPFLLLGEWLLAGRAGRPRWRPALSLCALPLFFLLPWTFMNASLYHRLIPLENGEPVAIIAGGALGDIEAYDPKTSESLGSLHADLGSTSGALAWAVGEIARHPFRYAWSYLKRVRFVFLCHPALFVLALLGAWRHRADPRMRALALFCLYHVVSHCCMAVLPGYFQVLWPVLAVLGASFLLSPSWDLPEKWAGRLSAAVMGAAVATVLAAALATGAAVTAYGLAAREGWAGDSRRLDRAIAGRPESAGLRYIRGRRLWAAGELAAAEPDLAAAVAGRGHSPGRWLAELERLRQDRRVSAASRRTR